jgi:hypothetical protein
MGLWDWFFLFPDPGGVTCLLLFGPWRDKCFIVPFGPKRHKMFHNTPLAPGGTKCFIVPFGPRRHKMFHNTPLVPGGTKCFIIPFGPLRQKFPNNKCVNGLCRELGNLSLL